MMMLIFVILIVQRRRSAQDELMMRELLKEGDLISVGAGCVLHVSVCVCVHLCVMCLVLM